MYNVHAHNIQEAGKGGKNYHEGDVVDLDFDGPGNADGRMDLWLRSGAISKSTAKVEHVAPPPPPIPAPDGFDTGVKSPAKPAANPPTATGTALSGQTAAVVTKE